MFGFLTLGTWVLLDVSVSFALRRPCKYQTTARTLSDSAKRILIYIVYTSRISNQHKHNQECRHAAIARAPFPKPSCISFRLPPYRNEFMSFTLLYCAATVAE